MFTRLMYGILMMVGSLIAFTALKPVMDDLFTSAVGALNLSSLEDMVMNLYRPTLLGIIFVGLFFYVVYGDRRNER